MPDGIGYLRYSDSIETKAPDEDEAIRGIIASMSRESGTTSARYGHAVRVSHAKSSGFVKGTLTVLDNLLPELAQGLFARPGTHPVLVRFAQGPGELLRDRVSTHRGMSIKVFGVEGEKLPGHEGQTTQDFVLATGPVFPNADAAGFLRAMRGIEQSAKAPEGVKAAISGAARLADQAVKAVTGKDVPILDFFGHPPYHPLAESYHSQAAIRYGDHVAKIAAFPVSPALQALAGEELDTAADPNAFRNAVMNWFQDGEAVFDLRVQLCTDLERMPVEDASVEWPEGVSPYRTVARIALPQQDAFSPARQVFVDEVMAFRPGHSLAAHRPLGSLMRARLAVYPALSELRHAHNTTPAREPASIDEVPD
ncbi:MAG: catalase family protein [Methylobacterium frigidaeris]